MTRDTLETSNMGRRSMTITASVIFVIAVTTAFLMAITIYWITDLKTGAKALNDYGYERITYDGDVVEYGSFQQYQFYYFSEIEESDSLESMDSEEYERYNEEYEKYKSEMIFFDIKYDDDLHNTYMGRFWLIEIISLILIPISLIIAITKTGQKNADGTIKLGWFDRILTEVDFIVMVLITLLMVALSILFITWLYNGTWGINFIYRLFNNNVNMPAILEWFNVSFFDSSMLDYLFEPRWVLLVLSLIGTVLVVTVDFLIFLSLVRKLKARYFLRSTLIGKIIYGIHDAASKSPRLKLKVLGTMITTVITMLIFALLISEIFRYSDFQPVPFIIGALIIIVIILLTVPRQLHKYEMVRAGINELQNGNFTYKIPDLGDGELGRLAESVNSITEAQDIAIQNELKSQRLRTDLISNVSHDIRTPLTSMVSYVDLLKKEGLNSKHASDYVRIISEKTDRLQKLTDDLFEAAKASSGDIPVNMEKLNMGSMVEQALAELEENLKDNNIDVILTNHAEESYVYADGKLLWRVLENILTNVTKYALSGTRAYMDIYDLGSRIALEVKNMSRDQLNISSTELLERFKRGDSSRNTEGSGLGLAIANDLTALMGGNFDISIDGDLFKAVLSLNKSTN